MRRMIVAGVAAVVGIVFIVMTFSQNLFHVGTDFEEMITDFRPILQEESIATYQADIQGLAAAGDEFSSAMVPGLSLALQMTPQELQQFLSQQFPEVSQGMTALPQMADEFGGLVDLLAAQRSNFMSADAIPTTSMVAQTVPWGFFFIGLIIIGLGALAWVWNLRFSSLLALVLGLLIVVGSFVLSLPGKSGDADALNDALKPVYTAETVQGAQQGLQVMGAMGEEMSTSMIPALAQQLQMTPDELNGFIATNFPAIGQALTAMPDSLARFTSLAEVFQNNLENYDTLKPVKFTPIIWTFIIGGLVLALAGAYGLFSKDKEPEVEAA